MPSSKRPTPATFYWHDYETFGTDSRRDRPVQFAGLRTDAQLEPMGEPLSILCQPAPDVLPQPESCLITGITPQRAAREGIAEAEFAAQVHEQLAEPGTCGVGFNSIRFDDEFTRNLLYRNFYDPYEREWKNGNSRWDIIDLARMCYALRPQGVAWPRHDDGKPSFRLEHLAAENHLSHTRAHDALSDVEATLALARLLRGAQPRLWDFFLTLRQKKQALALLDFVHREPVLHVSSRYPAERGCLAMIVPLAQHPQQQNKIIVYDLASDPSDLLQLDADEIADRVFTPNADLPDEAERISLKSVSINKSPALAPLSTLKDVDLDRIGLDPQRCLDHLQRLQSDDDLPKKLRRVFASTDVQGGDLDPELAIYAGFAGDDDKRRFSEVRRTPPDGLAGGAIAFRDARYNELLFRYRARNFPETLDANERRRWEAFREQRLTTETAVTTLTLDQYFAEIAALRTESASVDHQLALLDQLEAWGRRLAGDINPIVRTS